MKRRVLEALRPLDGRAIQAKFSTGVPDINFTGGWIELKWLRRWPKNADREPVAIKCFTPAQRAWLSRRTKKGGLAWLFVKVGDDWMLFRGDWAAQNVGLVGRPGLMDGAVWQCRGGLDDGWFLRALIMR